MIQDILSLAKQLISIPSVPDQPAALNQALQLVLSRLPEYTIEQFEDNGVQSALVYQAKLRPKKFRIILNGHLDVIPGKAYQYLPRVKGDKLYGVGSMDMKANVACLLMAFKEVANKVDYSLGLQLTTDEEIGGFHGTKYQVDQGVRADFVLAGEPTNFDIVNQAKGVLWVTVTTTGKTAHGAYPWRGENAIWRMNEFLNRLNTKYPAPQLEDWVTTVNVSGIETSHWAFNKIPDECLVRLDIRYIPVEAKSILGDIKALLLPGCKLDVIAQEPALLTDSSNKYIQALQKAGANTLQKEILLRGANGTSDARHYTHVGGRGIEFGPIGGGIGSDHEWVDIPSLEKYYLLLKQFLLAQKSSHNADD